ncbi:hypothetical protein GIB67_032644 [Kingdonia uniflora]|uniref:Xyloglucan endotransglucosylase/hydrolase n=1 Tax=Kingdonia uniflora TaxID=39325 RepID=A0A7J7P993_9MAGN|nr:hypothetical protein GIB67_032644 [Kingdonia uniflora]
MNLPCSKFMLGLQVILILALSISALIPNFHADINIFFGGKHAKISNDGRQVDLLLDKSTGSGFQTKNGYIFGKFDVMMKLVPGNSAGTVTTFYLNSSWGTGHDEIDIEFLGDVNGKSYTMQTNVFTKNVGNREQRIKLCFYADNIPIRVYETGKTKVPFPSEQPMNVYATLWDGSDWATAGGRKKVDWKLAPFTVSFRDFNIDGCVWSGIGLATTCSTSYKPKWIDQKLTLKEVQKLAWVRKNYMYYDYCTDPNHHSPPPECALKITAGG